MFQIANDFKGTKFLSLVTEKGESISTKAPSQSVETELVADPKDATEGFSLSEKNLKLLFGDVPKGLTNSLSIAQKTTQMQTGHNHSKDEMNTVKLSTKSEPKKIEPVAKVNEKTKINTEEKNAEKEKAQLKAQPAIQNTPETSTEGLHLSKPVESIDPSIKPSKQYGVPGGKGLELKTGK